MFLNPIGLLALLAVPAVVALHLFRRRFRPREVSSTFLWRADDATPSAGRRRERLVRSPSLWLELALAGLLAVAFAGPRGCAGTAEHLVLVLDSSASMAARAPEHDTRAEAVALARRRIEALPRDARVTLVASGRRPDLLAGPAAPPGEARAALERWLPAEPSHDLAAALALGSQASGGGLLLVSDRLHEHAPPHVELAAVGASAENVAVTRARRAPAPAGGGEVVSATVVSFAAAPVRARVALESPGREPRELAAREVELGPREALHLDFDTPEGAGDLVLAVARTDGGADALALDDRAFLAPPPPRTLALASTLPAELERELRLAAPRAREGIGRWLSIVRDAVEAPDAASAHLAVGLAPAPGDATWSLVLERGAGGDARRDLVGPFLVERRHPLVESLALDGIVWSADPDLALPGAALVSAGDLPLLSEERDGARAIVRLSYEPARSTLHRSPDWPILLHQLAELRRAELPGPERTSLAAGEPLVVHGLAEGEVRVVPAAGEERAVRTRGTLVVPDPGPPGFGTVERGGAVVARYGVSLLDAAESDLAGAASGARRGEASAARVEAEAGWPIAALLALALAVALADWTVLARGRSG